MTVFHNKTPPTATCLVCGKKLPTRNEVFHIERTLLSRLKNRSKQATYAYAHVKCLLAAIGSSETVLEELRRETTERSTNRTGAKERAGSNGSEAGNPGV